MKRTDGEQQGNKALLKAGQTYNGLHTLHYLTEKCYCLENLIAPFFLTALAFAGTIVSYKSYSRNRST